MSPRLLLFLEEIFDQFVNPFFSFDCGLFIYGKDELDHITFSGPDREQYFGDMERAVFKLYDSPIAFKTINNQDRYSLQCGILVPVVRPSLRPL